MSVFYDICGCTDIGKSRKSNQDQFLLADISAGITIESTTLDLSSNEPGFGVSLGKLLIVADGMGGHNAGERASSLAVTSILQSVAQAVQWFFHGSATTRGQVFDQLTDAVLHSQMELDAAERLSPDSQGMGTTLTMACVVWPVVYVAHVGDSRCYLIRKGSVKQLTTDHNVAQKFVEEGTLDPTAARSSELRNVLWNVIGGGNSEVQPEGGVCQLQYGDRLLLCTDGLTRHVQESELSAVCQSSVDAEEACKTLVERANDRGGMDNITAVIAHFQDRSPKREQEPGGVPAAETHGLADTDQLKKPSLSDTDEFGQTDIDEL